VLTVTSVVQSLIFHSTKTTKGTGHTDVKTKNLISVSSVLSVSSVVQSLFFYPRLPINHKDHKNILTTEGTEYTEVKLKTLFIFSRCSRCPLWFNLKSFIPLRPPRAQGTRMLKQKILFLFPRCSRCPLWFNLYFYISNYKSTTEGTEASHTEQRPLSA
jgi:hypothetical protein